MLDFWMKKPRIDEHKRDIKEEIVSAIQQIVIDKLDYN